MKTDSVKPISRGPGMARWSLFVGVLLCYVAPPAWGQFGGAAAARPAPVQIEDLYEFDGPQAMALSPNERQVAYVRTWIDRTSRAERQSLWLVDEDAKRPRKMEEGEPDARAPTFSPDGRWIVFRSTRRHPSPQNRIPAVPPESDAATDIWLIRVDGGGAIPLAGSKKPYGRVFNDSFYGRVAFSPDGKRLVFVADEGRDPRTPEESAAGASIVRPDQGEGYTGYGPAQIWVADLELGHKSVAATAIRRLTDDDIWYGDPQWSPDGQSIVVHANKTADRESVRFSINKNYDLWRIDIESGSTRQITDGPGPEVSPRFSPDGKRLACLSVPRKGPHADIYNVAIVTLTPSSKLEVVFDAHGQSTYDPSDPVPQFPLPEACWDGDGRLLYTAAAGTRTETRRIDLVSGQRSTVSVSRDEPAERLTALERSMAAKRRLTPPGNAFLKDRLLGTTQLVRWSNDEGTTIEGLVTSPHRSIAQAPFKLLLMPHGGPHSRSTEGFNFNAEVFAAQGYAVFQPNFRGSAGYGRKFLDADRGDFGGGDMRDILAGIDELAKRGAIDPQRQFVYGSSYGGFMTCWLVGHSKQFRAAVAQNAVTDLNMMWNLSDLQSWTEWEFGGLPWEAPEAMRKHSPLTYAGEIETPTLLLHARDDRRCPLPMGRAFHRALSVRGVATQLVVYPDEGHGIRQPKHREDVLRRVLAWFARHDSK